MIFCQIFDSMVEMQVNINLWCFMLSYTLSCMIICVLPSPVLHDAVFQYVNRRSFLLHCSRFLLYVGLFFLSFSFTHHFYVAIYIISRNMWCFTPPFICLSALCPKPVPDISFSVMCFKDLKLTRKFDTLNSVSFKGLCYVLPLQVIGVIWEGVELKIAAFWKMYNCYSKEATPSPLYTSLSLDLY